jgi:hypothetical protein
MWGDRLARGYAILRGVMVIAFCAVLIFDPERLTPGSSAEPARSFALVFASRSILLGLVFIALALRRKREGLAWVFLADAALQLFDTGLSVAQHKGAVSLMPFVLGVLDVWAAQLLRSASTGVAHEPGRVGESKL